MKITLFATKASLPVIRQAETGECGLACVAMIASYFGYKTSLSALRREFPISAAGATLKEILNIAAKLNLNTRPLKFELSELNQLQLPAILHWDFNHFVVLKKVSKKKFVIHDPAVGERVYTAAELSSHATGVGVELNPNSDFVKTDEREINKFSDLFKPVPGFYRAVGVVIGLSLLLELFALISPFYLTLVFDAGLTRNDPDWNIVLGLFFLMVYMSKAALTVIRGFAVMYLTNQVGFQMANNVFHHLIRLPLEFFEKRDLGDVLSRFGSIDKIRDLITKDMVTVIVDGVFSVITLVVLFWLNAFLATLCVGTMALFIIYRFIAQPFEKERNGNELQEAAALQSNIIENLRAMETIKLSCSEQQRYSIWQGVYAKVINAGVRLQRLRVTSEGVQALFFGLDYVVAVYFANSMMYEQELTTGQFMAFIFLKQQFMTSVAQLIPNFFQLKLTRLHLSRLADITFEPAELEKLSAVELGKTVQGGLSAKNLTFAYPGTNKPILEDFSMEVSAGEIVAIRGVSGSGKSTLIKLLTSLLRPTSGKIYVDGVELESLGSASYRRRIAAVLQRTRILSGSIAYNITLEDSLVDLARLESVTKLVGVHNEIAALPMGFRTILTDAGNILSAGQTQRVLIARALYSQPKILFLDEALTNVDEENAQEIINQIAAQGITLILVTRNRNVLEMVDRVIQLQSDEPEDMSMKDRIAKFKAKRDERLSKFRGSNRLGNRRS